MAALRGDDPGTSTRSTQRHVSQVTGLTANRIRQIVRARKASEMLQRGDSILDVTHELGYADQAHLTREWQSIAGCSPRQWMAEELPYVQDKTPGRPEESEP
jgi:AraC-like DNA-binding protein